MQQIVFIAMYLYINNTMQSNNASIQSLIALQELLLALHGMLPHLLLRLIHLGNDPSQSRYVSPPAFERYRVIPPYFN
jgi:hypothetical protein